MKIFDVVLQMYSDFESIFTNVAGVDVFSKTNDDRILSVVGTFFKIDDDWILFNVVDVAHVEAEVFSLTQNLNWFQSLQILFYLYIASINSTIKA